MIGRLSSASVFGGGTIGSFRRFHGKTLVVVATKQDLEVRTNA